MGEPKQKSEWEEEGEKRGTGPFEDMTREMTQKGPLEAIKEDLTFKKGADETLGLHREGDREPADPDEESR